MVGVLQRVSLKQGLCERSIQSVLARTIHESLLRRPILSPGEAVLVRPSRRTASTPASASRASSLGGLPSRTPCDGIHE